MTAAVEMDVAAGAPLRHVALHEAAHAVVAVLVGEFVVRVSLPGRHTELAPVGDDVPLARRYGRLILVSCASNAAHEMIAMRAKERGEDPASAWSRGAIYAAGNDAEQAYQHHLELVRLAPGVADLAAFADRARLLVHDHWPAIERVADLLLERRELLGADVVGVVQSVPSVFLWAIVVDPSKANAPDYAGALRALARLTPAYAHPALVIRSGVVGAGNAAVPDHETAVPGGGPPGVYQGCLPG